MGILDITGIRVHQGNGMMQTLKETQDILKQRHQSPDLSSAEYAFHLLKVKLKVPKEQSGIKYSCSKDLAEHHH